MLDIVSAGDMPKADGIDALFPATALKNFSEIANAASARNAAKRKGALLHTSSYELEDGVLLDIAASNGAVLFSFSDVLRERGFRRGIILSKMRLLVSAARKRGCGLAVCTLAKNESEVRNARELVAFMAVLGMNDVERKEAEKNLERLASI